MDRVRVLLQKSNSSELKIMHLRYRAEDESWDIDLKLEGMSEEEIAWFSANLQTMMYLWYKVWGKDTTYSDLRDD